MSTFRVHIDFTVPTNVEADSFEVRDDRTAEFYVNNKEEHGFQTRTLVAAFNNWIYVERVDTK